MKKTALVFGSTGLVGGKLLDRLLGDARYGKVRTFVRRATGRADGKLEEHVIDFDSPGSWTGLLKGDELFSCLGTTIGKAKTKENQYRVDYTYQFTAAKGAAENGVKGYFLVSSAGADPGSRIFYSRMKGELDRDVQKLPYKTICILRPSILAGERTEKRLAESAGIVMGSIITGILPLLKKYRPIRAEIVAQALVNAANRTDSSGVRLFSLEEIFTLAGE